jgi:hypothetical protein
MLDDVAVELPGANPSGAARVAAIVHGFELDEEPSAEGWLTAAALPDPSAEGWPAQRDTQRKPSAEVREGWGEYRVHRHVPPRAALLRAPTATVT